MQNYTIEDARNESANIAKNIYGATNVNDKFPQLLEVFSTVILHSHNNNLLRVQSKTNINNMVGLELDVEGEKYNVIRQQQSQAEGQVIFNITNILAQIDIGTEFIGNGNKYNSTLSSIGEFLTLGDLSRNLLISKIETFLSTKTAIVYCENHGLASGIQINGYGFSVAGLNGLQTISTFDKNSFTFTNNSIASNSTVIPNSSEYLQANIIKTNIRSVEGGSIQTIAKGVEVVPTNAITYVNSTGYVDYNEIGLGADTETDDNYRKRIATTKTQKSTIEYIKNIVLNQAGVTRVAIAQSTPTIGNFTLYFLRDNDNDPIPTTQETIAVKNILIDEGNLHPTITADNVFVNAPTEVKRRFVINGLLPSTSRMEVAITAQLQEIIYNIGIQDTTITPPTTTQLITQLIQKTQDSIGNTVLNITSIDILDINDIPASLSLAIGEFISVDNISFA